MNWEHKEPKPGEISKIAYETLLQEIRPIQEDQGQSGKPGPYRFSENGTGRDGFQRKREVIGEAKHQFGYKWTWQQGSTVSILRRPHSERLDHYS